MITLGIILLSAFLFALEEYAEWKITKTWDVIEHVVSIFHRGSLLLLGYTYAFGWYEIPFLLGLYWVLTDGLMNLMKKRNFLAVSNYSGNPLEKMNIAKIVLIVIGIVLIIVKDI